MSTVFKDKNVNQKFLEQGFYVVNQLLSKAAINQLTQFYKSNSFSSEKPFVSTNYSTDKKYRRKIFNQLNETIAPAIDEFLNDYQGISAAMFVKKARQQSKVGLHIDWQMVEEPKHIGLNVWVPLVNTNRFNGCIKVVPGSHKNNLMLRGPNWPAPQSVLQKPISKKHYKSLYLKAGDALIFDNRLMHLSEKNRLFKDRLAISFLMIPRAAQPIHYFFEKEGSQVKHVRKYKVTHSFYIEDIAFQNTNGVYNLSDGLGGEFEDVFSQYQNQLQPLSLIHI